MGEGDSSTEGAGRAAGDRHARPDPVIQTFGVLVAWLACNVAGAAFHHGGESRLSRLGRRPKPAGPITRAG